MSDNKINIQNASAASTFFEGVWKAHSEDQKQKFEQLIKDATNRSQKGDSSVQRLTPHTSQNTLDFFVKSYVSENTVNQPVPHGVSPLSTEAKYILADSKSQLNTRLIFAKVTNKLMNTSWDFKTAHFIKL